MPEHDEPEIESFDLLAAYTRATQRAAVAKFKATSKNLAAQQKANWAVYFAAQKEFEKQRDVLFVRLGVVNSPQLKNREVFAYLNSLRKKSRCAKCDRVGGWERRYLNFYVDDGIPVLLLLAMAGAPLEKVQQWEKSCQCLCAKCAKGIGAKLTPKGQPDLRKYRDFAEKK